MVCIPLVGEGRTGADSMADARLTLRQAAEGEGGLVGRLVGRLEAHAELWRQQGRLLGELDKMESTQGMWQVE